MTTTIRNDDFPLLESLDKEEIRNWVRDVKNYHHRLKSLHAQGVGKVQKTPLKVHIDIHTIKKLLQWTNPKYSENWVIDDTPQADWKTTENGFQLFCKTGR